MVVEINDKHLSTFLFAEDYVIIANDEYDTDYIFRNLIKEYQNCNLNTNIDKTEYEMTPKMKNSIK